MPRKSSEIDTLNNALGKLSFKKPLGPNEKFALEGKACSWRLEFIPNSRNNSLYILLKSYLFIDGHQVTFSQDETPVAASPLTGDGIKIAHFPDFFPQQFNRVTITEVPKLPNKS